MLGMFSTSMDLTSQELTGPKGRKKTEARTSGESKTESLEIVKTDSRSWKPPFISSTHLERSVSPPAGKSPVKWPELT